MPTPKLLTVAIACTCVASISFYVSERSRHLRYRRVTEVASDYEASERDLDRVARGLEPELIAPCRNRGPGMFAMSVATCTEVVARRRADETRLVYWAGMGSGFAAACLGCLSIFSLLLSAKSHHFSTTPP